MANVSTSIPLHNYSYAQQNGSAYPSVLWFNPGTAYFQPPVKGVYLIHVTLPINTGASTPGGLYLTLQKNATDGTSNIFGVQSYTMRVVDAVNVQVTGITTCNGTSDYINLTYLLSTSGSATGYIYGAGNALFTAVCLQQTT